MLRTAIQGLLARRLRLVMTALAVTLGVAFMAGTMVLTATVNETFDDLFADVYRGTDAVVRARAAFEGVQGTGTQRGRVDASLVPALQLVPGVAAVEGNVFGYARLVGKDGKAIGNPASRAPTVGANWDELKQLNPFTLVAGRPPRGNDEVVIDKMSSTEGGFAVGETATVLALGPPRPGAHRRHRHVRCRRQPGRRLVRDVHHAGGSSPSRVGSTAFPLSPNPASPNTRSPPGSSACCPVASRP